MVSRAWRGRSTRTTGWGAASSAVSKAVRRGGGVHVEFAGDAEQDSGVTNVLVELGRGSVGSGCGQVVVDHGLISVGYPTLPGARSPMDDGIWRGIHAISTVVPAGLVTMSTCSDGRGGNRPLPTMGDVSSGQRGRGVGLFLDVARGVLGVVFDVFGR